MTSDEKKLMKDLINQASNKVKLLQKTITEKDAEIEQLKSEFKQLQTNAEILARGVRDLNHENYELTEKVKQAKIDVLNKLKENVSFAIWGAVPIKYIDKMIEELKK